ncbi:MAG: hypothetical protein AAB956_02020, partial [Patescibacteria group bacterium]
QGSAKVNVNTDFTPPGADITEINEKSWHGKENATIMIKYSDKDASGDSAKSSGLKKCYYQIYYWDFGSATARIKYLAANVVTAALSKYLSDSQSNLNKYTGVLNNLSNDQKTDSRVGELTGLITKYSSRASKLNSAVAIINSIKAAASGPLNPGWRPVYKDSQGNSQAKEICGGLTAGDKEKTTLIAVNQDQCQKDGQDICRVVAWAEDVAGNLNYDPQSAEHERKPRTMNFDRTDPVVFVASPLDGAWVNGRSGGSGGSQKIDVAVFDSRSNDCAISAAENVADLYAKISAFKSMAAFNWSGYTNFLGLIPTSKQDVRNLIRDFHEAFTDPLGKLKNAVLNIDFVNHCGVFIGDAANCQFQANSSLPVKF